MARGASYDAGSYTLREEQGNMFGLATKAPEQIPEEQLERQQLQAITGLGSDVRLQRVGKAKKGPAAPEGQMGFGMAFGAAPAANQLGLFGSSPAPIRRTGERGAGTTEALVGGLLVVGGTVGAVKLGTRNAAIALGASVAVAVVAHRVRRPRLSRAAAATAVGLAAGMVGQALARRA